MNVTTTIRTATQDDIEALFELFCKMDAAEIGSPMTTKTDVQNLLEESDIGSWVAVVDTQIVAFGSLRTLSKPKELRAQFGCLPEYLNAASMILEWLISYARAYDVYEISLWQLTGGIAVPCLHEAGWAPMRRYLRMGLELTKPWSKTIAIGKDIVVRQAVGVADLQLVHKLIEETLADHWDHHHLDFDTFMSTQAARPGHDLSLWYIASFANQPAGAIVGRLEESKGQIALLGALEQFRGRGVAIALLSKAFHDLENRGATKVTLDVDTDNATNAVRVYEKVGMKIEFSSEQWKIQI